MSKLKVPQGSVQGHGATFLREVKGQLSRAIINTKGQTETRRHVDMK